MKFSLWPSSARSMDELFDVARFADDAGWFGLWYADHYMPNTGSSAVADGEMHEAWAVLPAIAAVTEHVRIGPLVSPTSVHHPAILANRSASLDHVSGGRFVLGMGAGWQINEHVAYGIELHDPRARVDRFEEAIQIVRSLLRDGRTTFEGTHFRIIDAPCEPKPVQDELPILVGSAGPRMMRIVARHASEWNTWGSPEIARERFERFAAACDDVGRDPASVHRSTQALLVVADNADHAAAVAADPPIRNAEDRLLIGTSDRIVEAIGGYAEMGFDEFIVPDFTFGADRAERREMLERVDAEIVAQLR